jgi:hypothetical protein
MEAKTLGVVQEEESKQQMEWNAHHEPFSCQLQGSKRLQEAV